MQDASSKQQTKQKCKPNHQQTGLQPHSALPIRENQTNKQKLSTNLTIYKLTQTTGPTLGGQKPKGRKNSALSLGKADLTQNKLKNNNNVKAEKHYTNERTN